MNFFGFQLLFFIDFALRIQDFGSVHDSLSVRLLTFEFFVETLSDSFHEQINNI